MRRQVLERLKSEPGPSKRACATAADQVAWTHETSCRPVGRRADLENKNGRVVMVSLAAGPLSEAADWLHHFEAFWNVSLDRLAALVEESSEE